MRRRSEQDPLHQKKSLSQVFLKVDWPVHRMVSLLQELSVTQVVEIGPGAGVLTRALLGAGINVTAIEKDPRFAQHLISQTELWESIAPGRLTVVQGDILRSDLATFIKPEHGKTALVGNIPYHISSPIVQHGLEVLDKLTAILLMTQLEFAQRMAASANTKAFGSLTVFAQLRSAVSLEFEVPKTCFEPVPKVDSAVIMLKPLTEAYATDLLAYTEKLTRTAFSQRRKKLSNSVSSLLEGKDLATCPIDLNRRADALTPTDFVLFAKWLS